MYLSKPYLFFKTQIQFFKLKDKEVINMSD